MADLAKMFGGAKAKPAEEATPQAVESKPAAPVVGKLGGMFGAKKPVTSTGSDSQADAAKPAAESVQTASPVGSSGIDLGSLADLDVSDFEESRPKSRFSDETPAQAPTRELPEGLTKEQLGFVDLIDGIYTILDDAELLGGVIRNIMIELQSNPDYMHLVAPEDVRTWIRAMRDSMGLARVKKLEKSTKRSAGGKSKSKAVDDDMLGDLADLGISFD